MAFKVKDLMINDLSEPGLGPPFQNRTCNPITRGAGAACFTSFLVTGIDTGFGTFGGAGALNPFDPGESLESLSNLKEQLKQQLAQIEKQHAALEKNLQPQTVEEVDALSTKLNEALDELRALRAKLAAAAQPGD